MFFPTLQSSCMHPLPPAWQPSSLPQLPLCSIPTPLHHLQSSLAGPSQRHSSDIGCQHFKSRHTLHSLPDFSSYQGIHSNQDKQRQFQRLVSSAIHVEIFRHQNHDCHLLLRLHHYEVLGAIPGIRVLLYVIQICFLIKIKIESVSGCLSITCPDVVWQMRGIGVVPEWHMGDICVALA